MADIPQHEQYLDDTIIDNTPNSNDTASENCQDKPKGVSPMLIGLVIIIIILIFLYIARKTSNKSKVLKKIKDNEIKKQLLLQENEYNLISEIDEFLLKQKQYINGK